MRPTSRRLGQVILTLACLFAPVARAHAQVPFLIEGLVDGEAWSTTRKSNLLTRNNGDLATLARLQLWGAIEALPGLVLYGQTEGEGGNARPTALGSQINFNGDQYGIRYSGWHGLMLDGGKIQPVIGTFAPRHFSNRNPLIGVPDAYSLEYPLGVVLSGDFQRGLSCRGRDAAADALRIRSGRDAAPAARDRRRRHAGRRRAPWRFVDDGPYLNDALTPAECAMRHGHTITSRCSHWTRGPRTGTWRRSRRPRARRTRSQAVPV